MTDGGMTGGGLAGGGMTGGVTRIGVTGHRVLPDAVRSAVREGMRGLLGGEAELLTSLAAGADQLCADLALAAGGRVTAVIPGTDYEAQFEDAAALASYRRLLARCTTRVDLPAEPSPEAAYDMAGRWVVDHCELLVAVWDGRPARGRGGTAEVVAYARANGRRVTVLWPPGILRD
ncbi:hypothetical protein [Streptomyces sp. NPDC101234]|uniref:hypothetical protein n=1 Tax=Streptomyces sp. NPDC101234 TaxID=3366138 RepID=UPI0038193A47